MKSTKNYGNCIMTLCPSNVEKNEAENILKTKGRSGPFSENGAENMLKTSQLAKPAGGRNFGDKLFGQAGHCERQISYHEEPIEAQVPVERVDGKTPERGHDQHCPLMSCSAPPRPSVDEHPSSSEEGSFLATRLLIQRGWHRLDPNSAATMAV